MTISNAIKKVEKAGFKVSQNPNNKQFFFGEKPGCDSFVEFARNGREDSLAFCGSRHKNDQNDSMSDYCATIFTDNITQAIRLAQS